MLVLALLPMLVSCEAWKLERAGRSHCEEGLALVLRAENTVGRSREDVMADLKKGTELLREGMSSFAKAGEKTGKAYDVKPYLEALIAARKAMVELRD